MFHGRSRNKIQAPYTLQDMYNKYIFNISEDSPYYVEYSVFIDITTSYLKKIVRAVLDKSKAFYLPNRLGSFQIVKKSTRPIGRSYIDWPQTEKLGKRVWLNNDHSNGYKYLWFWDRHVGGVANASQYRFVPTRENKRKLAYYIKNKIRDYFQHDY